MATVEAALETQLGNIEKKTSKTRGDLVKDITASGKQKHGEIVSWLKTTYALGHGDANTLTHFALRGGSFAIEGTSSPDDILDTIYADKKAGQRPIHEALMAGMKTFGEFELSPKKGYVSLRRKKQFAMMGPKTNDRFELGLNLKEPANDDRAKAVPEGGMCQYIIPLTRADEVDASLLALIKRAYDAAG